MAEVTPELIKELRERTQSGMLECKKALVETGGDMDKAIDLLRKKGIASAVKKSARQTKEGIIATYIHNNSKLGVMLELTCETDFVAKNDDFKELAKEICMQIAASSPTYINPEEVPAAELEHEKEIYKEQMKDSGKQGNVLDKIIENKMKKYYTQVCLMEQEYIRDPKIIIKDLIKERIAKYGENITVARFARYQIGK